MLQEHKCHEIPQLLFPEQKKKSIPKAPVSWALSLTSTEGNPASPSFADGLKLIISIPGLSGMRAAGQVSVEAERNHQVSREDGRERRRGITAVEKREGVGREKCYKSTMTTDQGDGKVSPFQ